MTEHARQQSGGRTASGGGMTWKSGLLGASLGVVVLGWAPLPQKPVFQQPITRTRGS